MSMASYTIPLSTARMVRQPSLRILLIEDEPGIAHALARLLGRDGHTVATADNGHRALEMLHGQGYDLILCNLRLPVCDGPAFPMLLLRWYPHMHQRLIFVTGDAMHSDSMAFLEQCGRPCLLKPCTIADVRRVIQQVAHSLWDSS
jgi:CheY-like chemotaxis protein